METNKNIHDGHRARLVDLALNAGLDNLSDVQVTELFLTYIFPRGDVNPLAHKLLDTYGSLSHIIDASYVDLMNVKGVNERTAKRISLFGELFFSYSTEKMRKNYKIDKEADLTDIFEDWLRFRTTENMVLIGLSAANSVVGIKRIVSSQSNEVQISMYELTAFLSSCKPVSLAIGHCHPYGRCQPSPNDYNGFEMINKVCFDCGIRLIDSCIIGEDGVFSQVKNKKIRAYCDVGDVINIINKKRV